jgi:SAM-dependent methyltransferase
MDNPFATADMAAGYASARPPVHSHVLQHWREQARHMGRVALAVDLGCGSGLSTRPLLPLATRCLGVEPAVAMLPHATRVAPGAWFAAASGEQLPLRMASVDLVVAAGSLNYVRDFERCVREVHRVLRRDGRLMAYDFATGRHAASGPWLNRWFDAFVTRYPRPTSEARPLDPDRLARLERFRLTQSARVSLALPMTREAYAAYVLTETNVAASVRGGTPLASVRAWIARTLGKAWPDGTGGEQAIEFDAYWAELVPIEPDHSSGG